MPRAILLAVLSVLAVTVLVIFVIVLLPKSAFERGDEALADIPETLTEPRLTFIDPVRGAQNAAVTIVEYGDFLCPLCQSIAPDLRAIVEAAPARRRFIWKDAPDTNAHPAAITVAMAARCAQDQGAFWPYYDRLMEARGAYATAEQLQTLATEGALNASVFSACMSAQVTRPVVLHTLAEAFALGVDGTPALYINGVVYTGALTRTAMEAYLESL